MSEVVPIDVWPGRFEPLGAAWHCDATNFAVYAPRAQSVTLCLFDGEDVETRIPVTQRTMGVWHCAVPHVQPGTRYGYRVGGQWQPEVGLCFDEENLLVDPYARAVTTDQLPDRPRGVVVAGEPTFDWTSEWGDRPQTADRWSQTVIYELHVKGFTALHDRIPEELRGTYAGLAHPVVTDYLRELGVTAVELLPVHHFLTEPAVAARGMTNYWGYNTLSFFAPHAGYASGDRGQQVCEFKQMVKDFHAAGIAVILDVVYNHTAEGRLDGPVLSLRGFDDRCYLRSTDDPENYRDLTGCGNTVDTSYPPALRLVMDSLRYWVTEMHVDGFRFDLAGALARTEGEPDLIRSAFLTAIIQDPVLREVKLIAEPWDASPDGYQVGRFPAPFCEWNDRFRDTVRDFWRGRASVRDLASRLAGSSDLYANDGRSPYASINFVTAHDGFTLRDLVSYERKHNLTNGEDGHDGTDDNRSWNCGVEGETDDPAVLALRHRQAANLLLTTLLSTGVPMLTAGDERGRTQYGNNNPYVQDNELSWIDWRPDDAWLELYAQARQALELRRNHETLRQRHFFDGRPARPGGPKDLAWLHPDGSEMNEDRWFEEGLQTLGMFVSGDPLRTPGPQGEVHTDASFVLWVHAGAEPIDIKLADNAWISQGEVVLSTDPELAIGAPVVAGETITLTGRSLVLLRSR